MTAPSTGLPNAFSTSPEKTQSCPCRMRARGLMTRPAMGKVGTSNAQRPTSNASMSPSSVEKLDVGRSTLDGSRMPPPLTSLDLPIPKLRSGKVREVFDLGDTLLFVATDRLSAFDCILPDPIPDKGAVLNQISAFWFQRFTFTPNHMIAFQFELPPELEGFREQLVRR